MAVTLLDERDYQRFKDSYLCYYDYPGRRPRALVTINHKQRDIAWWIVRPPKGQYVDHINRDTLDNRRSNLRSASKSENARNAGKPRIKTSSQYKGVCWFPHDKRRKRWRAYIVVNGKQNHIGYFATEQEAAEAWNKAARRFHGQFAHQNPL